MPEIIHNFTKGRMNQDLDERLVPSGEYRDALNIEVSTSEGSNKGTVQTTMGNINLSSIPGLLPTSFCVGSIADEKHDRLYWLIASDDRDIIAEYDYNTETVTPVLVDMWGVNNTPRVLNFVSGNYITGINIIDDMLFWTDNHTEPKHINLTRCKAGSIDFVTHTDFLTTNPWLNVTPPPLWLGSDSASSRPIREEHITVIKESPKTPPSLELKNTTEGKVGGMILDKDFTVNGDLPNVNAVPTPATMIELDALDYSYEVGDVLLLTTTNIYADELQIRVKIGDVYDINNPLGPPSPAHFWVQLLSIDNSILGIDTLWEVELAEKAALFQFKFPRFAYRYKYEDGEYSAFSPFTEVAFLPEGGKFDFNPVKGFNLSMVNDIRHLAVKDFVVEEDLLPDGVTEIDILYKESNSSSVYSVKSLKRNSDEWNTRSEVTGNNELTLYDKNHAEWSSTMPAGTPSWQFKGGPGYTHTKGYIKITSEMIHAILPENQLLRPWDNVPRKALAQEITKNRLIYGNYLQNYNVPHPSVKIDVSPLNLTNDKYPPEQIFPINAYKYYPAKSVKSLRTYQLGVVYIDKYGRETPVFSEDDNNESSIYLEKKHAVTQNKLKAQIKNPPPDWAESFKFFIKETSNEYYNLAVDRWYDAKDENVWLSFPSSERNKVDEDTFLILKKQHDGDGFVKEDARYKVLAISNEAPLYIKESVKSFGEIHDSDDSDYFAAQGGDGFPLEGYTYMWVDETPFKDAGWNETLKDKTNLFLRMVSPSAKTQWYPIANISKNSQSGSHWQLALVDSFKTDINLTSTNNSYSSRVDDLRLEVMQRVVENKPEFDGRFFVKIHKDLVLKDKLIGQNVDNRYYVIKTARSMPYISSRSFYNAVGTYSYTAADSTVRKNTAWYGWDSDKKKIEYQNNGDAVDYWGEFLKSSGDPWRGSWFIDAQQAFVDAISSTHELYVEPLDPGTALDKMSPTSGGAWYSPSSAPFKSGYDSQDGVSQYMLDNPSYYTPGQQNPYIITSGSANIGYRRGVSRDVSRINISFSGMGRSDDGDGHWNEDSAYTGGDSSVNANNVTWSGTPLGNWSWYVSELFFINTLTANGTLWRFKEDPDQIVHKTYGSVWEDLLLNFHYESTPMSILDSTYLNIWTPTILAGAQDTWELNLLGDNPGNHDNNPNWNSLFMACGIASDGHGRKECYNKAARRHSWNFKSKSLKTDVRPGLEGDQGYLPSNPPNWVYDAGKTHQIREYNDAGVLVQVDLDPATATQHVKDEHPLYEINNPNSVPLQNNYQVLNSILPHPDNHANNPNGYAPGIRHDGMPNGTHATGYSGNVEVGGDGHYRGSSMIEILEEKDPSDLKYASHNPAIFETEPKEDVGLDIYYEVGQEYPIILNGETNEQYIPIGSNVTSSAGAFVSSIWVSACNDNTVTLLDDNGLVTGGINIGDTLWFRRADGSATSAIVDDVQANGVYVLESEIWNREMHLPWFNCYSFGNGVESDRVRDDYNQVTIDNGPKASTTLKEPYMEERRNNGLIYSGIYNSISGVNNLNQFIQAEKITKDLNPTYGSIQKLHSRDTNLVTLCEDKILKILANKDALYNADGDVNVTATSSVLGQTTPFVGEFGISKNPESFAKESYRVYFSDKTRGSVCRLSQDGITPISQVGMKDWFSDNLRNTDSIVGSFDDKKESYNITLNFGKWDETVTLIDGVEHINRVRLPIGSETLSFGEDIKGWSSFKSFIQENGLSMNNTYYTFSGGDLWQHHANETRNNYYGTQFDSYVRVLLNEQPGAVKSFGTLNYEGSQAKNTPDTNDVEYYNNFLKFGWYVEEVFTNLQNGTSLEFKDKEGKWFSEVKGESTKWLDDGNAGNIDTQEFSYQGIGNADVECPECPTVWKCIPGTPAIPLIPAIPPTPYIPAIPPTLYIPAIPGTNSGDQFIPPLTIFNAPSFSGLTGLTSWLSGIQSNTDFEDKKICVPDTWSNPTNLVTCPCSSSEVASGFEIGYFRWSYSNPNRGISIGPANMAEWSVFINALIATNDPIFTGVTYNMSYSMLITQMTSNFHNPTIITNQLDYGTAVGSGNPSVWTPNISHHLCECTPEIPEVPAIPGVPEVHATPGVPAVPSVPAGPCFCIETIGLNGHVSKTDCENDLSNCCSSGTIVTACLPCSDPNADTSVPGCCFGDSSTQTNYNPLATCDDGSCIPIIYGCMDSTATNYNPLATVDDGSCLYGGVVSGCTDPNATNYNSNATIDDGSCVYPCTSLIDLDVSSSPQNWINSQTCPGHSFQCRWGAFPNNETAIEAIANIGATVDFRGYRFLRNHSGLGDSYSGTCSVNSACCGTNDSWSSPSPLYYYYWRQNARISHRSINNWLGYTKYFYSWKDLIDEAYNSGQMTNPDRVYDPGKANTTANYNYSLCPGSAQQANITYDAQGYAMSFSGVEILIAGEFLLVGISSGGDCEDALRTYSTVCGC